MAAAVANSPNISRSPDLGGDRCGGGSGVGCGIGSGHLGRMAPSPDAESNGEGWPPLRCTPSLRAPQGPLVEFLTSGYGYDSRSVAAALALGNEHFEKRELTRAINYYGAAYEIGRLHFDYKPLMHDLVLRRVICFSLAGDFQQAMKESELALQVMPNSAPALLYQGLLHSKMGQADEANAKFQGAVAVARGLRDTVDALVALLMLAQGHNDRCIQICTHTLQRCPQHTLTLLVRGDAYKFHASGYFARQAADDYTALLQVDSSLEDLLGERPSMALHTRFDELLLRFEPRVSKDGPRPYEEYPLCLMSRKHRPFLVASYVLVAVAKLKASVRSTQLVQDVSKRNAELLQARASAERKVRQLVEAQQKLATSDVSPQSEVWGPADPASRVRRYRRYWMEKPLGFPRRSESSDSLPAAGAGAQGRSLSPGIDERGLSSMTSEAQGWRHAEASSGEPLASRLAHLQQAWSRPTSAAQSPRVPAEEAPALLYTSAGSNCDPQGAYAQFGGAAGQAADHLIGGLGMAGSGVGGGGSGGGAGGGGGSSGSRDGSPHHPAALRRSKESVDDEQPPFHKLGEHWSEKEWLAKALTMIDTFTIQGHALPTEEDADGTQERRTAAAAAYPGRSMERIVTSTVSPCDTIVRWKGSSVKLVDFLEEHGLNSMPDWFTALDRIYEVCDMGFFHVGPEAFVAERGLAGAPGYSFVVPSSSSSSCPNASNGGSARSRSKARRQPRSGYYSSKVAMAAAAVKAGAELPTTGVRGVAGAREFDQALQAEMVAALASGISTEALLKRYQDRIVMQRPPKSPAPTVPAAAATTSTATAAQSAQAQPQVLVSPPPPSSSSPTPPPLSAAGPPAQQREVWSSC